MTARGGRLGDALVIGSIASVTSSIALGVLAQLEGKASLQPVNATSHWLNGRRAALVTGADATHTAVGYATHHAATVFWAALFERWIGPRQPLSPASMLQHAVAMSAVAAAVDYVATPKRFTPGWEFVLTKRSMSVAYGAMAAGLAGGALLCQRPPAKAQEARPSFREKEASF